METINNDFNSEECEKKMNRLNIFYHSPKELTTDAFWVWLLYFLDSDEKYRTAKQSLFDSLILRDKDKGRNVGQISVERQKAGHHGRVDFVFTFTFLDEMSTQQVLFEDKTWSSTTDNQLTGYKEDYPEAYRYFYYKLAYINKGERECAERCGFDIITARMMEACLSSFCSEHVLIKDYRDYIKDKFADYIESFDSRLFDNREYDLLWDAQVQLFLADRILDVFPKWREQGFYVYNGTSSGRPWTEISISESNPIIPGYDESIFWRIDIRKGQFYIRLNQYSWYEDDELGSISNKKRERLKVLREISNNILSRDAYSLKQGKPTDVGSFEQEIVIFFLPENDWETIFKDIPRFTEAFLESYRNTLPH